MSIKKNIGVVGLGLIGGSIAKDLRGLGYTIMGVDLSEDHLHTANELGLIDVMSTLDEVCNGADIIVLSVPVSSAPQIAVQILDQLGPRQILLDTGSTKASICQAVAGHQSRGRFVPCHPLAGTEFSGPTAAIADLFKNKKNIICEEHLCEDDALDTVIDLIDQLGMQNIFMSAQMHDEHMAYVSHLSHVSSFMLGSTVLEIEEDEKQIFNLASTGFASTVRLAKSSPETWSDIFVDNAENISTALTSYIDHLQSMNEIIKTKDKTAIKKQLQHSNEIRRILHGIKYNILKIS